MRKSRQEINSQLFHTHLRLTSDNNENEKTLAVLGARVGN